MYTKVNIFLGTILHRFIASSYNLLSNRCGRENVRSAFSDANAETLRETRKLSHRPQKQRGAMLIVNSLRKRKLRFEPNRRLFDKLPKDALEPSDLSSKYTQEKNDPFLGKQIVLFEGLAGFQEIQKHRKFQLDFSVTTHKYVLIVLSRNTYPTRCGSTIASYYYGGGFGECFPLEEKSCLL